MSDLSTYRKATAWKRFHKATQVDPIAEYRFNHISDGWLDLSIPPEGAFAQSEYSEWQKEFMWLTPSDNKLVQRKEYESRD